MPRKKLEGFEEIGVPGLETIWGQVQRAYAKELYWPEVEPLYTRIWRGDAETSVVRAFNSSMASGMTLSWDLPEMPKLGKPNDADKRALEYVSTLEDDIGYGGIMDWLIQCCERVSFYGWGFWETPLCLRKKGWHPPGERPTTGEPLWESHYDDGLVGIRKLAWRDYTTFHSWEMDNRGTATGFTQIQGDGTQVTIPFSRGLHITFGDNSNPEGLGMLEAIYRLERLKYGLEMIMGLGFEHAAGHVKFRVLDRLTPEDKETVRAAARALLTAQEGNYITEIQGKFEADIMDVPFSAAADLLEAVRYYGILKLTLYGLQFVALSSLSGAGSYAALDDASSIAVLAFNAMKQTFVRQFNRKLITRLFAHPVNDKRFAGRTRLPVLVASDIAKTVNLEQLGLFVQMIASVLPLGRDDVLSIRQRSGLLAETIPDDADLMTLPEAMTITDPAASTGSNQKAPTPEHPKIRVLNPPGGNADKAPKEKTGIPQGQLPGTNAS